MWRFWLEWIEPDLQNALGKKVKILEQIIHDIPGSRLDSNLLTRAPDCALSSRARVGVYVRPEPHSSTAGITGATWHQLFISQLLQLADGGIGLKELRVVIGKESEGFSVAKSLAPCLLTQQTLEEERLTLLEVYSSGALISQQRRHWQLVFTFVCLMWGCIHTLHPKWFWSKRKKWTRELLLILSQTLTCMSRYTGN